MAISNGDEVKSAIETVGELLRKVERAPDAVRFAALKTSVSQLLAELPSDVGGQQATKWAAVGADVQKAFVTRLEAILSEVDTAVAQLECNEPGSLMARDCLGNPGIYFLLMVAIVGIVATLFLSHRLWDDATGSPPAQAELQAEFELTKQETAAAMKSRKALDEELAKLESQLPQTPSKTGTSPNTNTVSAVSDTTDAKNVTDKAKADEASLRAQIAEKKDALTKMRQTETKTRKELNSIQKELVPASSDVLLMVILMGALGGFIHLASSMSMYVGNRALRRSWVVYYLLSPLQGAALAPIIYLLLTTVILSPAGGSATASANMNLTGIYAFAALTGLFSKQAVEKLAEVFATLFTKISAKDSLAAQK